MAQNENEEIIERKRTRLKFRILAGTECNWPIKRWLKRKITRNVPRKLFNIKTNQYDTVYTEETKTVQVALTFEWDIQLRGDLYQYGIL